MTKIVPLPGYCLVEPIEEEEKTSGGVYVPETSKDKPSKGKILEVGKIPEKLISENEFRYFMSSFSDFFTKFPQVEVGQIVIYKKWTNQEVEHEGKKYLLVKFDEILAVIE